MQGCDSRHRDRSSFLKNLFEEHGLDSKKIRDTFLTHLKGYAQGSEGTSRREKDNSVVAVPGPPPVMA